MTRLITTICATISLSIHCLSSSALLGASLQQDGAKHSTSSFIDVSDTTGSIQLLEEAKSLCYDTGQEFACIQYSKRLCELKKCCYGELSEEYLLELLSLSELYSERLRPAESYRIHDMAYEPYMQKLRDDFGSLGLDERQVYWREASKYIRKTLDIAYKTATRFRISDASLMAGAAYNATLLYKGILLSLSNTADVSDIPQLRITWKDVRNQLNPEDLAIEFFRTDDGKYGAILIKKTWKSPKLIRLSENRTISSDSILDNVSSCLSLPGKEEIGILSEASKIVWPDRLLQYFPNNGKGKVYFSSDGMLLQTGIEYLPFEKNVTSNDFHSIMDVYDLVRLSSTRELVTAAERSLADTAALYGGIDYSDSAIEIQRMTNRKRGAIREELPGTYEEVTEIRDQLVSKGINVRLKAENDANIQSFVEMGDGKYGIVHIATHGMYWSKAQKPMVEDPLERSGLLFSDGLVTAKEISRINLGGSSLVVLSACRTALGDMSQDGVFGLQRGFKMAGVGTMLMSLWEVDDIVTKELMTSFYSILLQPGQTKHTAFKTAVESIRNKYPDPYYWAAFIMLD